MGTLGKFSSKSLKQFEEHLKNLKEKELDSFLESCVKELAARLLTRVKKLTPAGVYPHSGKVGGTLRRGWTSKTYEEAKSGGNKKVTEYVNTLEIEHVGSNFTIEVKNPVEYATYVEYGHRTRDHKGWVKGKFMLTISEQEIESIAPKVLEAKLKTFLTEFIG